MKLQERLRSLRKEHHISQIKIAEKLDVSRQTVSRWETGESIPTTENLMRLSELYGVSLDDWWKEDWPPPKPPDALEQAPVAPEQEPVAPEQDPVAPAQEPAATQPNVIILELPVQEHPKPGYRTKLWRPILIAATLAVGIAIGALLFREKKPESILSSDLNSEVIDITTMGETIELLPPIK